MEQVKKKRNRRTRPVKTLAELVAMPDDYMASVGEAAAYIGVTPQCVYHSATLKIPVIKLGPRVIRVRMGDLRMWLKSRGVGNYVQS